MAAIDVSTLTLWDGAEFTIVDKTARANLDNKLETSLKGASSGLAELDATGKVPSSQLPENVSSFKNDANYQTLDEVNNIVKEKYNHQVTVDDTGHPVLIYDETLTGTDKELTFIDSAVNAAYEEVFGDGGSN